MGSDPPPRYERLDAVRGIAAILVMGYHLVATGGNSLWPLDGLFGHGYRGILVFFVLSGFLVARPFLKGPVAIDGYVVRRAARLFPAYIVALVGISLVLGSTQFTSHAAAYLLFLQNYDPHLLANGPLAATWTLQLEVQFYLVLPVLAGAVVLLDRGRGQAWLIALCLIGLVSMAAHIGLSIGPDPDAAAITSLSLPAMLWAFLPGIAMAWVITHRPAGWRALASGPVVAIALVAIGLGWFGDLDTPLGLAGQDVLLATGIALLMPALVVGRPVTFASHFRVSAAPLASTTAAFGRTISYPFYLWHLAVILLVLRAGLRDWPAFVAVLLIATLVGLLSYRLVEDRGMRAGSMISALLARWHRRHEATRTSVTAMPPVPVTIVQESRPA